MVNVYVVIALELLKQPCVHFVINKKAGVLTLKL